MDIDSLATQLGQLTGIQPSTLVLYIFLLGTLSNVVARLIPADATGPLGFIRKVASVIGAYVPSRVSSGVSVVDVAKASLETPPIPEKVEAETGHHVATPPSEPLPPAKP